MTTYRYVCDPVTVTGLWVEVYQGGTLVAMVRQMPGEHREDTEARARRMMAAIEEAGL